MDYVTFSKAAISYRLKQIDRLSDAQALAELAVRHLDAVLRMGYRREGPRLRLVRLRSVPSAIFRKKIH